MTTIKELREKKKISQEDLAKLLGLGSGVRISEYEHGTRKPSKTVMILVQLLAEDKITLRELMWVVEAIAKDN